MKKWECTVCGYIHVGEEPPETCPVCGADKSQFIEITETKDESEKSRTDSEKTADEKPAAQPAAPERPAPSDTSETKSAKVNDTGKPPLFSYESLTNLMVKHHLHPISVHFPNGIIPMAVAFIFLAVIFQFTGLAKASFYSMIFVVLTLPAVLFTGYNEWKKKYRGSLTRIFMIKIISAGVVTGASLVIVLWYLISPNILETSTTARTSFLLLHLILLAATGIAGHIGGKLVFKD